jgi:hypothetical protein
MAKAPPHRDGDRGRRDRDDRTDRLDQYRVAEFFDTLNIPLVRGRVFER